MDQLAELRNIVPDEDRIYVDGEELERHGRVFSYHAPHSPDAVVFPKKRDETHLCKGAGGDRFDSIG